MAITRSAPADVLVPAPVAAADFGDAVAAALGQGDRLLTLCRLPGGEVGAVCDAPEGVRGWRAAGDGPLARPSASGVVAALHDEARLEAEGVAWSTPAPQVRVHGAGVFTFPLGPVRADVAECAAWRLFVMGDEVLGLHMGFGYKTRGMERAMAEAGPEAGVLVAERVTATSVVAHAVAYAQAWEAALGIPPSPGAVAWRGVLAELERLHSHLGDLATLAASTGLPVAQAELILLREQMLRLNQDVTGHRYLRGVVGVGGLRRRPERGALAPARLTDMLATFADVIDELDGSTSFLDRLHGAGRIPAAWAAAVQPVGPVGRAAGVPYDVRTDRPYGPYLRGAPAPALETDADAWARYRVRVREVEASVAWLLERLRSPRALDEGPVVPSQSLPAHPVSGAGATAMALGRAEGPRGEVCYLVSPAGAWVRVRPASAVNWAVLPPAVAENNVMQDVPIIDASFGLSVAAMDR